ncbi:hypothetical protein DCAR_0104288 [Daucus carota subsp. sativus]|uniref:Uncharacterized protein n=1 Tax=Daucus carota subsp. sativus TaxID=79200 RepID=A0A166IQ52_DAUCS|nr:PREDICTED: GDSL esterase/lipase At5g45920 [Daucus carota subsp. sativus]WOG85101.1 hypothetical protein DCAR_0104288 [Daucus carota subsp. sativus]
MRPKMVLFGDSITEESFNNSGWGASLTHHFARVLDILVRGYSGYNTRWALKVLERVFPPQEKEAPVAIIVFFGANDAALPDRTSAYQHVPLDEYRHNLHSIVSYFKERWPSTLVILVTPPPIDEDGRLKNPFAEDPSGLPERTNEAAGAYAKACASVAEEYKIPVINLWNRMQKFPNWEKLMLRDGLHLTCQGNKLVFDELISTLRKEGLSLDTLPMDLPALCEIDPNDPLKSFEM